MAPFYSSFYNSPYARFEAGTEHFNNTHVEPNGRACFGTRSSVSKNGLAGTDGSGIKAYNYPRGVWETWLWTPTFIIEAGYIYLQPQAYWAFETLGW